VTGAGKGIGRDIVRALVEQGVRVIALSRTQADLDLLTKEFPGVVTLQCDLGSEAEVNERVAPLEPVDFLVNNAGVAVLAPFLTMSLADFDRVIDVNLRAVFQVSQLVARKMVARGKGGAIVNISSAASRAALRDHAAYCASKAGLDHLTRVMALELGPHKIRANTVNPTVVMTDMGRRVWSDEAKSGPVLNRIPLGSFPEPHDVSNVVVFLLSEQAFMVNGSSVAVEGGMLVS
jgi:L-xylulose reductase